MTVVFIVAEEGILKVAQEGFCLLIVKSAAHDEFSYAKRNLGTPDSVDPS